MTHKDLVEVAARWLEATRRCSLVLTEFTCAGLETPDAIGWRIAEGWSVLVECKVSRGDFLRDLNKPSRLHREMSVGQERWYLTPPGLLAVSDIPGGWGLLETTTRVRIIVRCPASPEAGTRRGRGVLDRRVQANELAFLLSAYRRKLCTRCSRSMYRGEPFDAENLTTAPGMDAESAHEQA